MGSMDQVDEIIKRMKNPGVATEPIQGTGFTGNIENFGIKGADIVSRLGRGVAAGVGLIDNIVGDTESENSVKNYTNNLDAIHNAIWGIGANKGVGAPPVTPKSPDQPASITQPPLPAKMEEVGQSRYTPTDIYGALKMMDDANFKKFVDKHGEEVPGIGYVDGKGENGFQRVINKPNPEQGDNINLPAMSVSSLAGLINSMAERSKGVAAREQNQVYKEGMLANAQEKTGLAKEAQNQRAVEEREKTWAPKTTDSNGSISQDMEGGMIRSMMAGDPNFAADHPGIAKNVTRGISTYTTNFLKDKTNSEKMKKLGITEDNPDFTRMMMQGYYNSIRGK